MAKRDESIFLIEAARMGKVDNIVRALDSGANIEAVDRDGWTPLQLAIMGKKYDTVIALLERGADINHDNDTHTPLMSAVVYSTPQIVRLLVEKGANVDAINDRDKRASDLCKGNMEEAKEMQQIFHTHNAKKAMLAVISHQQHKMIGQ